MKKSRLILLIFSLVLIMYLIFRTSFPRDHIQESREVENVPVTGQKKTLPVKDPPEEELDLEKYKVNAIDRRGCEEDLVVQENREESLERVSAQINGGDCSSSDDGGFSSMDLPPKVRDVALQLKDMIDTFDETTLETTKDGLNSIPGIHADPSEARIRVSGDRVTLKVTIPEEDLRIGRK